MVASRNPDKVREVEEVLASLPVPVKVVRGLEWSEVAEDAATLEGNALLKARAVARATGEVALADDTGLEVDALGGAPGVRTARFAGENASYLDNVRRLLLELEGVDRRGARFVTVVALVTPEGEELTAEGSVVGRIATEPRGNRGFGYDPVFEVDGRTFGEMSQADKHAVSHRARALRALAEKLSAED